MQQCLNATVTKLPQLPVGKTVQLSSQDGRLRFLTSLVGIDGERAIVAHLPSAEELKERGLVENVPLGWYEQFFLVNQSLVLRLVEKGVVYAFETSVQEVAGQRRRMLVMEYPVQIFRRNLRKEARYPCMLVANMVHEGQRLEGTLKDISIGGCQVRLVDNDLVETLIRVRLAAEPIELEVLFPHEEDFHTLRGRLTSVSASGDRLRAGIAFDEEYSAVQRYMDMLRLN